MEIEKVYVSVLYLEQLKVPLMVHVKALYLERLKVPLMVLSKELVMEQLMELEMEQYLVLYLVI